MTHFSSSRFRTFLLLVFLSVTFLASCSKPKPTPTETPPPQTADTEAPTLLAFLSEQRRTVTETSILIMGSVSDESEIKSFSYALNGGDAQDVLSSLVEGSFSFTVSGLKQEKNTVLVTTADASGNKAEVTLEVEVFAPPVAPTLPLVEGTWTTEKATVRRCGEIDTGPYLLDFSFDAPRESGAVAGLWQSSRDGYQQAAGSFAGTLDASGTLEGVATLIQENSSLRFDFNFTVKDGSVEGVLTAQEASECSDETTKEITTYALVLKSLVDDKFEDNSERGAAAELTAPFSHDLMLMGGDKDWFTFTLKEGKVVTLGFRTDKANHDHYYDTRLTLHKSAEVKNAETGLMTLPLSSGEGALSEEIGLAAGTYYLEVDSNILVHQTYQLSVDLADLPDKAYEPNESVAQAKAIATDFSGDFYLSAADKDWFSFELDEAKLVTLYLGDRSGLYYEFVSGGSSGDNSYYHGQAVTRALKAGVHYLGIYRERESFPYSLRLSTAPLPDKAFEPNDTFNSPSEISLPFTGDFFISSGDEDWFKFSLSEEQVVTLDFEGNSQTDVALFTDAGVQINGDNVYLLEAGTYRLKLFRDYSSGFAYTLTLSAEASSDSFYEPNNSKAEAYALALDFSEDSLLAGYRDSDWYSFTLEEATQVSLSLTSENYMDAELQDASGSTLDYIYRNSSASHILSAGTYYVYIDTGSSLSKYGLSITKQ